MWQLNDKPYHAGVGTNSTRGWPSQRRKNYSVWPRKTVIGRPVYLLSLTKVNFIELLCTAGLPAMYTAILTQQGLSPLAHYGYLALYILAYIADDTLMVVSAVWALSSQKLDERQGRWLKFFSGVVMLALGLVMWLRPEWLY